MRTGSAPCAGWRLPAGGVPASHTTSHRNLPPSARRRFSPWQQPAPAVPHPNLISYSRGPKPRDSPRRVPASCRAGEKRAAEARPPSRRGGPGGGRCVATSRNSRRLANGGAGRRDGGRGRRAGRGAARSARTFVRDGTAHSGPDPRGGTAASRPFPARLRAAPRAAAGRAGPAPRQSRLSPSPSAARPRAPLGAVARPLSARRGRESPTARGVPFVFVHTAPREGAGPRPGRGLPSIVPHWPAGGAGARPSGGPAHPGQPSFNCARNRRRRQQQPPQLRLLLAPALGPPSSLPPSRTAAALAQADGVSAAPRPAPPRRRPAAPRPSPQTFGAPRPAPRRRRPALPSPSLPRVAARSAGTPAPRGRRSPLGPAPDPPLLPFRRPPPTLSGAPGPASPRIGAGERRRSASGAARDLPAAAAFPAPRGCCSASPSCLFSLVTDHIFFPPYRIKNDREAEKRAPGTAPTRRDLGVFERKLFRRPPPAAPARLGAAGGVPRLVFGDRSLPARRGAALGGCFHLALRPTPEFARERRRGAGRCREALLHGARGARPPPPESCPLPSCSSRPFPRPSGAADARRPLARSLGGAAGREG